MGTGARSHSRFEGDPASYSPLSSSYCMQAGSGSALVQPEGKFAETGPGQGCH